MTTTLTAIPRFLTQILVSAGFQERTYPNQLDTGVFVGKKALLATLPNMSRQEGDLLGLETMMDIEVTPQLGVQVVSEGGDYMVTPMPLFNSDGAAGPGYAILLDAGVSPEQLEWARMAHNLNAGATIPEEGDIGEASFYFSAFSQSSGNVKGIGTLTAPAGKKRHRLVHVTALTDGSYEATIDFPKKITFEEVAKRAQEVAAFQAFMRIFFEAQ